MKFKKVKVLLNSEGDILTIVQRTDDSENQLYIVGLVLQCRCKLICRTNVDLIDFFLQGRCSVSDLFRWRSDEPYIMEFSHRQEKVVYDNAFESILNTLECKNKHFYQVSPNMRIDDPMEFLRFLKMNYVHSFASVTEQHQLSGQSFIARHPELFE